MILHPRSHFKRRKSGKVIRPGHNVWQMAHAERAAMLVDGGVYFSALRAAMINARRSIHIVGWDIDSRTSLVGEAGTVPDEFPETFGPFLGALTERRPELSIKLLLWNYSFLYSLEREFLPTVALGLNTPSQVELCLDNSIPIGSSHHQKIVIIDDAIAFSGGIDLTVRRWDNSDHTPNNAHRLDPNGEPYRPFHDVQMLVDGEAAACLAQLVRERWHKARGKPLAPVVSTDDPWPHSVEPNILNVDVGIARTQPAYENTKQVREIEQLYLDMLDAAEEFIYIENQFVTSQSLAQRLATVLTSKPALRVLIVSPKTHHTWFEHQTMLAGRIRFMEILRGANVADRVRLVYPQIFEPEETDVMVHSKVTIIDDRLLRVGSANLCNRSMGTDTECDLVLEASTEAHRRAIAAMRNGLLAEHCGATRQEVETFLNTGAAPFDLLDRLEGGSRALCPIDDGELSENEFFQEIESLADPCEPIGVEHMLEDDEPHGGHQFMRLLKISIIPLGLILLTLIWRYTPLSSMIDPGNVENVLTAIKGEVWTVPLLLGIYVIGGLVAFPVTLLIAATAITFGLWPGLLYALIGSLLSALVTYLVGAQLGQKTLRRFLGERVGMVAERIGKHGIVAMTMVRMVPVLPFSVVNVVAGALRVRLFDYMVGTFLGLAPGLIILSLLGDQLSEIMRNPSWGEIGLLSLFVLIWVGLGFGLQALAGKIRPGHAGS